MFKLYASICVSSMNTLNKVKKMSNSKQDYDRAIINGGWNDFQMHLYNLNRTRSCVIQEHHVKAYYNDPDCKQRAMDNYERTGSFY